LQRDVTVQGLRLRAIDVAPTEDARGTLLLVHGHTSRLEEYDAIVAPLSKRYRVIVPDLPGSGYSDKPSRPYTLALLEDALLGLLDALGVRRCHLGGGSLGGNLTLRLALREPERFDRLVPWAPAGGWRPWPKWLSRLLRIFHRPFIFEKLFWPTLKIQSRYWYEPSWPGREAALAESFAYYREVYCPAFARMYWQIGHEQMSQTLLDDAPSIRHPTLMFWGDRDFGLDMGACVKRLVGLMPNARLHVFAGARHSLAQEVPNELARRIDRFLSPTDSGEARLDAET
jgi:2-hydroxy-6-oxonona-2,4-dienedioate hydrolase